MRKGIWWREREEGRMLLGTEFAGKSLRKGVCMRESKEADMEERV